MRQGRSFTEPRKHVIHRCGLGYRSAVHCPQPVAGVLQLAATNRRRCDQLVAIHTSPDPRQHAEPTIQVFRLPQEVAHSSSRIVAAYASFEYSFDLNCIAADNLTTTFSPSDDRATYRGHRWQTDVGGYVRRRYSLHTRQDGALRRTIQ